MARDQSLIRKALVDHSNYLAIMTHRRGSWTKKPARMSSSLSTDRGKGGDRSSRGFRVKSPDHLRHMETLYSTKACKSRPQDLHPKQCLTKGRVAPIKRAQSRTAER